MKIKLLSSFLFFISFVFTNYSQSSDNEFAARNWIKEHSKELNIQPFHNFKLTFVRKGLAGETLRFQQMLNDVPVYDSEIVVNFVEGDKVSFSSNNYDAKIAKIDTNPSINTADAIAISNDALKFKGAITYQDSKLCVVKMQQNTLLVYRVVTNAFDKTGSWEVIIDAKTGAVLGQKDIAVYHKDKKKEKVKKTSPNAKFVTPNSFVSGAAKVFNPDPLSQDRVAYAGNYVDNNDITNAQFDAARTQVVLPEIELASGVYKLKSTYVEIQDLSAPSKGLFTQSTPNFFFDRENDAFEAANAFYHLDNSMRYINNTLGIRCIPLTNSGVLFFDPSGANSADNSYYTAGTLNFGEGGVDDAEDADVVLHEMGHGIHDWMTGGRASSSTGLGEGNGDYWAMSYSRSLNQWTSSDAANNWVFSWDGHNDFWAGRVTNYNRTYPQTGATNTAIHTYGQIWATSLMKIYDVIGRTKTDKAFLEGLALTNSSSNQKTAAVAVRQAAINMNYPCADIQTMTDKFNATGYALPALTMTMGVITNQTVNAGANNTYSIPSYATLANPISDGCTATLIQSPAIGTSVFPGVYTITVTATAGATVVTRTFTLTVVSNLSNVDFVKNNIVIYPNPAKNFITIKGEFDESESITIFNLLGQKIMDKELTSNEDKIDVSSLSNGIYTIYFNNIKAGRKFIKE